jgi:predicted PurR-regulated permease PerM
MAGNYRYGKGARMHTPPPKAKTMSSWQARWFHLAVWIVILTLFVVFLRAVEPILLPFVLGMFVAYLMDPLAERLQRLGVGRTAATAIITLSLCAMIVALIVWLAPLLYQQLHHLIARAPAMLTNLEGSAREWAAPVLQKLHGITGTGPDAIPADSAELVQRVVGGISQLASRLFSSGAALINLTGLLLITPIVCFYLIRDWPSVVKNVDSMLPLAYADDIRQQIKLINRTLASYLRGQVMVMMVMSVFYIILFSLIDLNFGLVIGLLAGCVVIVPYLGSAVSIGLGLVVAYGQFGVESPFFFVLAVFGAGQVLEAQILTPKIIGDRVGLHPLWLLFGMLAGAVLLGFVGVLLAVPLTAVIGVLAKFALNRYLQSGLYLDQ